MFFQVLTTLILAAHFAFVAYVVVGGFLAWRWPRTLWLHLTAAAWGLLIIVNPWGWQCPLTYAEHWSRHRAGQVGYDAGFVDQYLEGVLYPAGYTRVLQAVVIVLVAASWLGLLRRWRTRRDTVGKGRLLRRRTTTV